MNCTIANRIIELTPNGMIDKVVELWEKVKVVAEGEQRKLITRKINERKYIAPKLKKKKK